MMEATTMVTKLYQIEIIRPFGTFRLDTVFSSADRAERYVQDLNQPFTSMLDGTEYPPMDITEYKIVELRAME